MKFIGLISGGKDSIYNILECIRAGHELVCLGNLHYAGRVFESGMLFIIELGKEMDSYMYQSVGSEVIEMIAKAMNKPLFRQ